MLDLESYTIANFDKRFVRQELFKSWDGERAIVQELSILHMQRNRSFVSGIYFVPLCYVLDRFCGLSIHLGFHRIECTN